jgi:PAS domain S-box-containing protein
MQLATELSDSFSATFELFSDMVIVTDTNANILFANTAAERVTGYALAEMMHRNPGDLWGGQMEKNHFERMWQRLKDEKKTYISVVKNRKKNGTVFWQETHIYPVLSDAGEVVLFVGFCPDVSERVIAEEEMHKRAVELELMNKSMVGRELRIVELKESVVLLKDQILSLTEKKQSMNRS